MKPIEKTEKFLGFNPADLKWIEKTVKNSLKDFSGNLEQAIEKTIEKIRDNEFGETKDKPSRYEYKIAVALYAMGRILGQQQIEIKMHRMAFEHLSKFINGLEPPNDTDGQKESE